MTTSLAFLSGRTISHLSTELKYDFPGIAIQQTFTILLMMATKKAYDSLPLNISLYLPPSELGHLFVSFTAGELIGEKIANYVGYQAPFYLFPAGIIALGAAEKLLERPIPGSNADRPEDIVIS